MCGIGGVLLFGDGAGGEALQRAAGTLNALQRHRGPDDEGIWSDGERCVLAHRRLSIIDLSSRGRQPMTDASGRYRICFNGEIYNYRELRSSLEARGRQFRTETDTEVLLAGFAELGDAVFARLDGMFALAIYDSQERVLTLARDRAGEKPLYYAISPGRIAFASELRPLAQVLEPGPGLDAYGVCQYLLLRYVPAPHTILEGIRQLEPATLLRIGPDGRERQSRFFVFDRDAQGALGDPEEAAEAVEEALTDAILRRLTASDVPVGAFLSSGIDSSLVCAIAAKRLRRQVHTFCAGFGDEEDETGFARDIAAHLGLPHTTYEIARSDLLSIAASFGKFVDEPNGDRSCVPVYALSRELRKRVTVAVSGDGGDELFCGYTRYPAYESIRRAEPLAGPLEDLERYFSRALPVLDSEAVRSAFPSEYRRWQQDFIDRYAMVYLRTGWSDAQRMSTLDFHTYLPGAVLAKVDKMSMRHALEVRTPFFAPSVLELASRLSAPLCGQAGDLKPLLRRILARYLGPGLVNRQKIGFGMPGTFLGAHRDVFAKLFAAARESLAATSFFGDRREALATIAEAAPRNANSLWALTVLGLWADACGLKL